MSTLTGAQKVDLQQLHKCGKWFCITGTIVESGFQQQHKCGKWFCNINTSVEGGYATPTQV